MRKLAVCLLLFVLFGLELVAEGYVVKDDYIIAQLKYEWITPELFRHIERNAKKYGLPPLLICAIVRRESDGDKWCRGADGEYSYMQPIPRHFIDRGIPHKLRFEPKYNFDVGCWYLRGAMDRSNGDLSESLRRYNQGWYGKKWKYTRWDDYVKPILKDYRDSLSRKERRYVSVL